MKELYYVPQLYEYRCFWLSKIIRLKITKNKSSFMYN